MQWLETKALTVSRRGERGRMLRQVPVSCLIDSSNRFQRAEQGPQLCTLSPMKDKISSHKLHPVKHWITITSIGVVPLVNRTMKMQDLQRKTWTLTHLMRITTSISRLSSLRISCHERKATLYRIANWSNFMRGTMRIRKFQFSRWQKTWPSSMRLKFLALRPNLSNFWSIQIQYTRRS